MEIIFNNVTYKENVNTPLEITYLKNASFTLNENKVYAFIGDSKSGKEKIGSLINATSTPYKGYVLVDDYVNDGRYIKKINNLRMNIGYIKANPLNFEFNKYVKEELSFGLKYFKYKLKKEQIRSLEALKLVGLNETDLNKKIEDLSIRERKLLSIILITKDTNFAYEVSDEIFLVRSKEVMKCDKSVLINEEVLTKNNLNVPDIVKFINSANKKGANLTYTPNILDLIKEVYRNV